MTRTPEDIPVAILEDDVVDAHVSHAIVQETSYRFMEDLYRQWDSSLFSCLRLLKRLFPLPNTSYHSRVRKQDCIATRLELRARNQITTFLEMNSFPGGTFISVAVDTLAMSSDRSDLPKKPEIILS
jgi:hypothetical protein